MTGYVAIEQRPLTTLTAEMICSTIKGVDMTVRKSPGTKLQNNVTRTIGVRSSGIHPESS